MRVGGGAYGVTRDQGESGIPLAQACREGRLGVAPAELLFIQISEPDSGSGSIPAVLLHGWQDLLAHFIQQRVVTSGCLDHKIRQGLTCCLNMCGLSRAAGDSMLFRPPGSSRRCSSPSTARVGLRVLRPLADPVVLELVKNSRLGCAEQKRGHDRSSGNEQGGRSGVRPRNRRRSIRPEHLTR
jgi:hypothetical protein